MCPDAFQLVFRPRRSGWSQDGFRAIPVYHGSFPPKGKTESVTLMGFRSLPGLPCKIVQGETQFETARLRARC